MSDQKYQLKYSFKPGKFKKSDELGYYEGLCDDAVFTSIVKAEGGGSSFASVVIHGDPSNKRGNRMFQVIGHMINELSEDPGSIPKVRETCKEMSVIFQKFFNKETT